MDGRLLLAVVIAASVGLGAVTGAGAVTAQEFALPTMKVGDRWTFRTSGTFAPGKQWTETVVEVLPRGRYRARIDGEAAPRVVEFDGPGNIVQPPPFPTLRKMQFPLAVGKAWSHAVATTEAQTDSIAYRAVAVERVKVPAGEWDCLRIEGADTTTLSGTGASSPVKLWYCPTVRQVVRKETRVPMAGLVTLELLDYKPAP